MGALQCLEATPGQMPSTPQAWLGQLALFMLFPETKWASPP